MSLIDALLSNGGKDAIAKVATNLGLEEAQAAKAVGMILPALTEAMSAKAEADGGAGLKKAVETGDHGRYLDQPDLLAAEDTKTDGNGILGHILGSKDASRAVASTVSKAVGIENDTVKQMLPVVASMAMGALSKASSSSSSSSSDDDSSVPNLLGDLLQSKDASKLIGSLFS